MENREYWSGTKITSLKENEIFVYGSNPQGINGAGAAKAAMQLSTGAKNGVGRGFNGSNAYAVVTKSLNAGFLEKSTGILYDKEGYCSVSKEQIIENISQLYEVAKQPEHKNKSFIISYQYETYPNGAQKKSLNGYTSQEMLEMFAKGKDIPDNIVFHDSYKSHLEKLLTKTDSIAPNSPQFEPTKKPEYTYFFHLTSPFSNFHPAKFEYKNLTFISNEQFMMYSKAKTFKDEKVADQIINIDKAFQKADGSFADPQSKLCFELINSLKNGDITRHDILNNKDNVEAWNTIHKKIKQLGRLVANYDDNVWSEKRVKVVLFGAREKFTQNEDLKQILLDTGDTIMVEASKYDKIWGNGLSEYDSKNTPPEKWPGQNLLGQVLTYLKTELTNKLTMKMKR